MVEKATTEEEEIVRSDRHTERIKEILRYTALGRCQPDSRWLTTFEVPTAHQANPASWTF